MISSAKSARYNLFCHKKQTFAVHGPHTVSIDANRKEKD